MKKIRKNYIRTMEKIEVKSRGSRNTIKGTHAKRKDYIKEVATLKGTEKEPQEKEKVSIVYYATDNLGTKKYPDTYLKVSVINGKIEKITEKSVQIRGDWYRKSNIIAYSNY